jgi:hypothetical protein
VTTDPAYETFCPQCEAGRTFTEGEVVVGSDGTQGFQGPCPVCGTIITYMLTESPKE